MANALYSTAREGFLAGEIDWDTATIKCSLVRGYTFATSHRFVSDVTALVGVAVHVTSGAFATKTITGGVADAADVLFTAVPSDPSGHGVLVFQSSAVTGGADVAATAQRLIAWYDTGTNLPVVPNGGDITIAWDNGAPRIFAL